MDQNLYTKVISSPLGPLRITCTESALTELHFVTDRYAAHERGHALLEKTETQLREFFARKRRDFDIPLDPQGTDFQKEAWAALCKIPYGRTVSYGEQAKMMGRTARFSRAVGGANNKNPIAIVIPCHRVIGASGGLTGYAGGLRVKEALLDIEKAQETFLKFTE